MRDKCISLLDNRRYQFDVEHELRVLFHFTFLVSSRIFGVWLSPRKSLKHFPIAILDAPPNDSGDVTGKHKSMSKIGASSLRRALFLVMSVYLQNAPPDEPVYRFMDRKRAEGKPYRVYMMASVSKLLRIYYATVKAYPESPEQIACSRHKAIGWPPFHCLAVQFSRT